MGELRVLSAGAAQAVVEAIAGDYERETGRRISGEFGAVGAIRQKVLDGAEADVIVLTGAMIDELVGSGHVAQGSRADLGKVGTGIAVRAGTAMPDVSTPQKLRGSLLEATRVVCPDPAIATAGKVVVQVL
jgi:molybdate transport system substrate-binding protein